MKFELILIDASPSLFDAKPGSLYWFVGGFNWRAIVVRIIPINSKRKIIVRVKAWCAGTGLTISGIADGYNPGAVSLAAVNLYRYSLRAPHRYPL
jgi:hypothetical protein